MISKLSDTRLPPVLYKFYGPERTDVLRSMRVRFSQLAALNDPFEFLITMKPGELRGLASKVARQQASLPSLLWMVASKGASTIYRHEQATHLPRWSRALLVLIFVPLLCIGTVVVQPFVRKGLIKLFETMGDEFQAIVQSQLRHAFFVIFSCSRTWDSVPMWAHYAANHRGFAIGLDPASAFRDRSPKAKTEFLRPRKVRYLKKEPRLRSTLPNFHDFVCAKMDHWSYEQEWRFIARPEDAAERGVLAEAQELMLFGLEPASIREIVFGANCDRLTAQRVLDDLNARNLNPRLFQIRRQAGYGFSRKEIWAVADLEYDVAPAGVLRPLTPNDFPQSEEAWVNLSLDAQQHPVLGRLWNAGSDAQRGE